MEGNIGTTSKIKGKQRMTTVDQFNNIKDWIEKLFKEVENLSKKLDTLEDKVNDEQHAQDKAQVELEKRLIVVEKFIEYRAKIEFILIAAVVTEFVGLIFLIIKAAMD